MKLSRSSLATAIADAYLHSACAMAVAERMTDALSREAGHSGEETATPDEISAAHESLYETHGEHEVWIVHGDYIRREIDTDFTNFGQHYRFLFIPEREFWLDNSTSEDEYQFYVDHMMTEYRLMKGGMDFDKALEYADRKERDERQSSEGVYRGPMEAEEAAGRVHKSEFEQWSNAHVTTWLIDGSIVRKDYNPDFTEGGHDFVYGQYIPPGEVWLDDENQPDEQAFFVLHELWERSLMAAGMKYDEAHHEASHVELEARLHPETLDAKIAEALTANEHPTIHHNPEPHEHDHAHAPASIKAHRTRRPPMSARQRARTFNALFRRGSKHEKKFKAAMRKVWSHERRIILANMKHAGHQKDYRPDLIERWLYPIAAMKKLIASDLKPIFEKLIAEEGAYLTQSYGLDTAFDVFSPEVANFLRSYAIQLADQIETTTLDQLKTTLLDGMRAGEGIPELTNRVQDLFDNMEKYRAERIARTETSRAQNQAALETYRQAGIEKQQWLTYEDEATCEECMGLDGEIVGVGDNFSNGDDAPPSHPSCRCTTIALLPEEGAGESEEEGD